MSIPTPKGRKGLEKLWQYHPRSDHHSKVACWGAVIDLLDHCPLLRRHLEEQKVGFGINHNLWDFRNNRKKALDLVICSPGSGVTRKKMDLVSMAEKWRLALDNGDRTHLAKLPAVPVVPVGNVFVALEAKACMTEFAKAGPRLHDELNSSHLIVHAASNEAIAVGLVLLNMADHFYSPSRNPDPEQLGVANSHRQPKDAAKVVEKLADLPRRPNMSEVGYDAVGIVVINCPNDGTTPLKIIHERPAPQPGEPLEYESMIHRISGLYASRFAHH